LRRDVTGGATVTRLRLHKVGSELAWVVAGQGTAVLGSLLGVRLLTGALPPGPYGELALGLTAVTLAQQTLLSPLTGASLRFFAAAVERGRQAAFFQALGNLMKQATAVLAAGAALLVVLLAATGRSVWVAVAALALLFALLLGYCSALDGLQNAARHRRVVAWHDGIAPWLRFFAAVAFVRILGPASWVAMLGYAAATALVLASQSAFFVFQVRGRGAAAAPAAAPVAAPEVREWTERIRAYAWPFMTWGVFSWAQLAADRWALETFASTREVGLYAVLYQLGYFPMSLASGLLTQLVAPVLFERAGDGSDPARVRSARLLNRRLVLAVAALTGLATALSFFLHEPVFRLLADARYREVSPLLPWMVLSGGLFATGQTGVLSVLSGSSTQTLVAPKIVTAVIGVGLAFAGAARGGLPGVVFAGLAASLLYCVWALILAGRVEGRAARG
jgi:O-antigen/teichoic acid export membrane protein